MKKKNSSDSKQREKRAAKRKERERRGKEKANMAKKKQVEAVAKVNLGDSLVSRTQSQLRINNEQLAAVGVQSMSNASNAAESPPSIRADTEEIRVARERINKIIAEIEQLEQHDGSSLIFRGESKEYKKLSSGLYRHYLMPRDGQAPLIDAENFSTFEEMVFNIEEDGRAPPERASLLDRLIDLQHRGGKTAFIDFTLDIHIALYFACNDNPDEDGRLFIFDKFGLSEFDKGNFDREYQKTISDQEEIYWINTVVSNVRATFQRSVFLCPKFGYLTVENYEKAFTVEAKLKIGILKYLDKYHGINEETIFPDLLGDKRRDGSSYEAFYRGLTLYSRGEYEEAVESYDRVLKIKPKFADVYNNRGNAKVALGRYEEAIKDYDKGLKINPNFAEAYGNRGIANMSLKQHKEAIEDYDQALKINSNFAEAYGNRGISKGALGRYAEAIEDYSQVLKINPKYAEAYNNRGLAKAHWGKHKEAIEDFDQGLKINPKFAEMYGNRGVSKATLGWHEEAIEDYSQILKINLEDAKAYVNRGIVKLNLGKYEEAIEDFEKALKIDSEYADAYYGRGLSKAEKFEQYEDAIKDYDKALRINPKYTEAYVSRGLANMKSRQFDKAIEDFDKALEINPEYADAYYFRGLAKEKLKRYEVKEVISDLQKALELFQQQEGKDNKVKEKEIEKILLELREEN